MSTIGGSLATGGPAVAASHRPCDLAGRWHLSDPLRPLSPNPWRPICSIGRKRVGGDRNRHCGPWPYGRTFRPRLDHDRVVRITASIGLGSSGANLKQYRLSVRTVVDVMAVGHAGRKSGAVPAAQPLFAVAGDQHHFALDHPNKLVFDCVPVPLARPLSRRTSSKQGLHRTCRVRLTCSR
jgi:hypothetical protein